MASYHINLHEMVYSLSNALDLVGVNHIHHGKRVAYMATEVGKCMGWEDCQLDDLFQSAILHDIGVSRTQVHQKLAQLEWELERDHCHAGHALLSGCPLLEHLSGMVLHHHTRWKDMDGMDIPVSTRLIANCIYLVDRVDVLALSLISGGQDILLGKDKIREVVKSRSAEWFHPELVEAFMEVSQSDAFWFRLEREQVNGYLETWLSRSGIKWVSFQELRGVVEVFSHVVDAKSRYTKEHSEGVANLARFLGGQCGVSDGNCDLLELAGLLHDIGKLRVPDELLEKPGSLNSSEYCVMHRHSFDTYDILKDISGLESVATWAAQHHERVDGSGYPYMAGTHEISLEARILAVSDVFQALAQWRPYRKALPPAEILEILWQEVEEDKLDRGVVKVIEGNLQQCWKVALLIE